MKKQFTVDFIGVGAAKSGTTWLSRSLREHPGVCMSEPKEVNYFNKFAPDADVYLFNRGKRPCYNKHRKKSLSWYKKHFSHARPGQKKGEFSVIYLNDPEAPGNIKRCFPDVKLLVCLRNPIDRAYSQYWMYRGYFKVEKKPFADAIKVPHNVYLRKGFYFSQLSTYLSHFRSDQIHVVLFDDIQSKPEQVFHDVCVFLGISPIIDSKKLRKKSNTAKVARSRNFSGVTEKISRLLVHAGFGFVFELLRKSGIKSLLMKAGTQPLRYPPLCAEMRQHLREIYDEDIKKLEGLLDRDLSHWT